MDLYIEIPKENKKHNLNNENDVQIKENAEVVFYFESDNLVDAHLCYNGGSFTFVVEKIESIYRYVLKPVAKSKKFSDKWLFKNYLGQGCLELIVDGEEISKYKIDIVSTKLTLHNCDYMLETITDPLSGYNVFDVIGNGITDKEISSIKKPKNTPPLGEMIKNLNEHLPKINRHLISKLSRVEDISAYKKQNSFIDESTFSWLCANLGELEEVNSTGQIQIDLEHYNYRNLQYSMIVDDYVTIENIFIVKFLYDLIKFVKKRLVEQENEDISNQHLSDGEFKSIYDRLNQKQGVEVNKSELMILQRNYLLFKTKQT